MTSVPRQKCLIDGCEWPEELVRGRSAGGLCAGHRYRKKRGLPMDTPLCPARGHRLTRWQMVHEAAMNLRDAGEAREAYNRAVDRFRKAAFRWAEALLRRRNGRAPSNARR